MPYHANRPRRLPSLAALLLAPALALSGCASDEEDEDLAGEGGGRMLFTLNSDYKSGTYSAFLLDSAEARKDLGVIGSDAVVRWHGGRDVFILNRLGRDNAQVIDRVNLETVLQFSFPAASNIHDIVLKDSLLYAGFYNLAKILIYHQAQGDLRDSIDISAHADTSDGKPEVADLLVAGGDLYVLLGNLDAKAFYSPLQARLVRIDLRDKDADAIDLPFGNPANLAWDTAARKLYIPCRGAYGMKDGGIVSIDLDGFAVADTLATEADLGGDVNAATFHAGRLYMDLSETVGGKSREAIVSLPAEKGATTTLIDTLGGYKFGGLAIDAKTGTLYVGDRENGLRIYDLATGEEADSSRMDLGELPILDMVLLD